MKLSDVMQVAMQRLAVTEESAVLEAEVLLAHVLQVSRSHLHAWPERILTEQEQLQYNQLIERRLQGEPVAYLVGHKEFWSLDLIVTRDTLIPRPETELLVECILEKFDANSARVVADLGTGSGAIALSIAKERPNWVVHATDFSLAALKVAQQNAKRLGLSQVIFHQGSWCNALPKRQFDAIISNPPYVEEDYFKYNQSLLKFEPREALVSPENGLRDIHQIIQEASHYLLPGGNLLVEHGSKQAEGVRGLFEKAGYTNISVRADLSGLDRVTTGEWRWRQKIS